MTPHPDEGMLHAFIDGELSPGEATALEAHVAGCGLCGAALAEARGFVAGASRAINELDTAPSSASRPVAARPALTSPARSGSRPFVFRVPFARAAALILLAGGSAVVINRSTSDNGATSSTKSVTAEAALTENRADATQPGQAFTLSAPTEAMPLAARIANDGNAATDQTPRKRAAAAPPSVETQSGRVAGSAAASTTPSASVPTAPPARMAAPDAMSMSSATPAVRVTRYRTKEGVTLILTEEPLRTSFAEESTVARRGVARPTAQASVPGVNSYRWLSAKQGRSFTLTGSLSVAELEAASKRLSELERVP